MTNAEENEHNLVARVVEFRGGEVIFEAVRADFEPRRFTQNKTKFPGPSRPQLNRCYELTLQFMPKSLKGQPECPHARISAAKVVGNQPSQSLNVTTTRAKAKEVSGALTAVVCVDKGDTWELFCLQGGQMHPDVYVAKSSFPATFVKVGAWYQLQLLQTPRYVFSRAVNPRQTSPVLPTRIRNGRIEVHTQLVFRSSLKTVHNVHYFKSKELGMVADADRVIAVDQVQTLTCWCAWARGAGVLWKVSALREPADTSNVPSLRSINVSGPQKKTLHRACKGVVCYKEDNRYHVVYPQLSSVPLTQDMQVVFNVGNWLESDVEQTGDDRYMVLNSKKVSRLFPSMPTRKGVLIECDVMVPISFDEADRTVASNFVGRIRDVYGLLDTVDPGVHKATIRYDCQGGVLTAHWQLEHVGAKKP